MPVICFWIHYRHHCNCSISATFDCIVHTFNTAFRPDELRSKALFRICFTHITLISRDRISILSRGPGNNRLSYRNAIVPPIFWIYSINELLLSFRGLRRSWRGGIPRTPR